MSKKQVQVQPKSVVVAGSNAEARVRQCIICLDPIPHIHPIGAHFCSEGCRAHAQDEYDLFLLQPKVGKLTAVIRAMETLLAWRPFFFPIDDIVRAVDLWGIEFTREEIEELVDFLVRACVLDDNLPARERRFMMTDRKCERPSSKRGV